MCGGNHALHLYEGTKWQNVRPLGKKRLCTISLHSLSYLRGRHGDVDYTHCRRSAMKHDSLRCLIAETTALALVVVSLLPSMFGGCAITKWLVEDLGPETMSPSLPTCESAARQVCAPSEEHRLTTLLDAVGLPDSCQTAFSFAWAALFLLLAFRVHRSRRGRPGSKTDVPMVNGDRGCQGQI